MIEIQVGKYYIIRDSQPGNFFEGQLVQVLREFFTDAYYCRLILPMKEGFGRSGQYHSKAKLEKCLTSESPIWFYNNKLKEVCQTSLKEDCPCMKNQ